MKTSTNYWWAHWNNDKLRASIENGINGNIAKFILQKYENYLGDKGFEFRYDKQKITLEHIAPQTEPNTKPHGYGDYNDEKFKNLIYSLGNYILLEEKQEIRDMVSGNVTWGKDMIKTRNKKIVKFVMLYYK